MRVGPPNVRHVLGGTGPEQHRFAVRPDRDVHDRPRVHDTEVPANKCGVAGGMPVELAKAADSGNDVPPVTQPHSGDRGDRETGRSSIRHVNTAARAATAARKPRVGHQAARALWRVWLTSPMPALKPVTPAITFASAQVVISLVARTNARSSGGRARHSWLGGVMYSSNARPIVQRRACASVRRGRREARHPRQHRRRTQATMCDIESGPPADLGSVCSEQTRARPRARWPENSEVS